MAAMPGVELQVDVQGQRTQLRVIEGAGKLPGRDRAPNRRPAMMDAVEQANSGHPGTPMALAPAAYVLWRHHLKHAPQDPWWIDRDRFVLSCGHSSITLYTQLYLSGYGLTLEDLAEMVKKGEDFTQSITLTIEGKPAAKKSARGGAAIVGKAHGEGVGHGGAEQRERQPQDGAA